MFSLITKAHIKAKSCLCWSRRGEAEAGFREKKESMQRARPAIAASKMEMGPSLGNAGGP